MTDLVRVEGLRCEGTHEALPGRELRVFAVDEIGCVALIVSESTEPINLRFVPGCNSAGSSAVRSLTSWSKVADRFEVAGWH